MADPRAFALKESVGDLQSGHVVYGDGQTLDVAARLANNDGVLVTTDDAEQRALEQLSVLKEVPVPKKTPAKVGTDK